MMKKVFLGIFVALFISFSGLALWVKYRAKPVPIYSIADSTTTILSQKIETEIEASKPISKFDIALKSDLIEEAKKEKIEEEEKAYQERLKAYYKHSKREKKSSEPIKKPIKKSTEKLEVSSPLKFQVITTKDYGQEMIGIQIKITNISKRHINRCEATCILQDARNKDLAFERHYVIKSIDGGLAPNTSTYFEYVIDCNPALVKQALFHIENFD